MHKMTEARTLVCKYPCSLTYKVGASLVCKYPCFPTYKVGATLVCKYPCSPHLQGGCYHSYCIDAQTRIARIWGFPFQKCICGVILLQLIPNMRPSSLTDKFIKYHVSCRHNALQSVQDWDFVLIGDPLGPAPSPILLFLPGICLVWLLMYTELQLPLFCDCCTVRHPMGQCPQGSSMPHTQGCLQF